MRIVGGELRGRTVRAVPGRSTRPTADRVRQSLFDALGQRCDGLRVLDLYAGTGALAVRVVRRNAEELGVAERCTVLQREVSRALAALPGPYDLVFSDPPYALRAAQPTLDLLAARELVAPGGRVVLERDRREPRPQAPAGFEIGDERHYGDTLVLVVHRR